MRNIHFGTDVLEEWIGLFIPIVREIPQIVKSQEYRGGSRISGKVVHTYKGVGVRFADFFSIFLNIS